MHIAHQPLHAEGPLRRMLSWKCTCSIMLGRAQKPSGWAGCCQVKAVSEGCQWTSRRIYSQLPNSKSRFNFSIWYAGYTLLDRILARPRSLHFLFGPPHVHSAGLFCYVWSAAALVPLRNGDWYFWLSVWSVSPLIVALVWCPGAVHMLQPGCIAVV